MHLKKSKYAMKYIKYTYFLTNFNTDVDLTGRLILIQNKIVYSFKCVKVIILLQNTHIKNEKKKIMINLE